MPRPTISLDVHKDYIIKLFSEDGLSTDEIVARLNAEYDVEISERTISRRLGEWNVSRKKNRVISTQELRDRITHHYNKNLNDAEISLALKDEGFDVNPRNLSRLRKKMNLRRRSRFPGFCEPGDHADGAPTERPAQPRPKPKAKSKMSTSGLIPKVTAFVESYMSKYDGSHDFNHIRRVVGLAHSIYTAVVAEATPDSPPLDLHTITLAALMHDVGDKKYLEAFEDANTLVLAKLLGFGAEEELAIKVQRIVLGVSYSSEVKNPDAVRELIIKYPELAVVQDADRLDAIGAIGVGRTFTYGGAKNAHDMGETIQHFEDKLVLLEGMMKTAPGRRMAKERTERLKVFRGWWEEEQREAEGHLRPR
ncbi:HD domain-containing protein [Phlyctema vagabunda]|uniref:HD domain-containing protein n=1 Tax=Phlyctema vagabunda TaxID=108571 RepID=A0ABR4PN88_9HELO